MRALWLSDAFWAAENRGTLIKSPVELVVGAVRGFGITLDDGTPLATAARRMGQDLFDPPNVKGWPGGSAWINSDTYLVRQELIRFITGGQGAPALPRTPEPMQGMAAFVQAQRAQARPAAPPPPIRREENALGGVMPGPGAMMDMAPAPQPPATNDRPTPFGAAIERWVRDLPEVWLPSAEVAALLVPLPPVDIATLDPLVSGAMVRRLLNDPVYQLK